MPSIVVGPSHWWSDKRTGMDLVEVCSFFFLWELLHQEDSLGGV